MGPYLRRLDQGELPLHRALTPTGEERLIRELILQLKLGRVRTGYFRNKFQVDILERFAGPIGELAGEGYLTASPEELELSRRACCRWIGCCPYSSSGNIRIRATRK